MMLKTMVFKAFQRKFEDRYTGPWAVIEVLPGNCYRIQETETSKPQIVHHDRLKPYRARNPAEHNTDWVQRVKARYAAIRSQPPRLQVPPSTGEDSHQGHTDTENELLRTVGPYDDDVIETEGSFDVPAGHVIVPQPSFDQEPAATDALDVADQRQEATSANVAGTEPDMVDVSMQVSFTEPESSTVATDPKLLSAKAADVTSSDEDTISDVASLHSNAEFSVAEFTPRIHARRQQLRLQHRKSHKKLPKATRLQAADVIRDMRSCSESTSSVPLADSQFLFDRESTPPARSVVYGLRRRPKKRVAFTP